MKALLWFIALSIGGKIIRDSLPPMGLRDLWRYTKQFAHYLMFSGIVLFALASIKYLSREGATEQQKERALALSILIMALFAFDLWCKKKNEERGLTATF